MLPEDLSSLDACLPADLRGPSTTITRVAAGLSGAGVYRVDAAGQTVVLKTAGASELLTNWDRTLRIQQLASAAGLAPRIVHVDATRRAIVTDFVTDRSFVALYWNPATRDAAVGLLGDTLRRVHALPLPPDASAQDARDFLARIWSGLPAEFSLPTFVGHAVQRMLAEEPPASDRPPVLSHNDVNPTNLVYDGERLLFFDWDMAGPNDPFYDLATASVFLRMDEDTCITLLSAHDGEPVSALPSRFTHDRRMVAVLCGTMFLHLARIAGHPGATGAESLDSALSLGEFYQQMRTGAVSIRAAEGQWAFGLALVKESLTLTS